MIEDGSLGIGVQLRWSAKGELGVQHCVAVVQGSFSKHTCYVQ